MAIAIEAKPNNASEIRKGAGQASSYLDWVHQVYLIVPPEAIELCKQLLKYSPIGILTVAKEGKIIFVKDAERNEPEPIKLSRLLNETVGFCWLCRRTFNIVRPSQDLKDSIVIAYKEEEPKLFKALEKIRGKKSRTKNLWTSICAVCSRILGEAISEYIRRALDEEYDEKLMVFDFWEDDMETIRYLIKKKGGLKSS